MNDNEQLPWPDENPGDPQSAEVTDTPFSFNISDPDLRQKWVDWYANQGSEDKDGAAYGRCCFVIAMRWARRLENRAHRQKQAVVTMEWMADNAEDAFREANRSPGMGITGFMYGMVVSILAQTWIYGDLLRRWHNKDWGQPDAKGTVNPALMSISVKG